MIKLLRLLVVCTLVFGVVSIAAYGQNNTTDNGNLLSLKLKAKKLKSVTVSQSAIFVGSFPGQCPGIGPAAFPITITQQDIPINDDTQYFDGTHASPVLEITHHRVTITEAANGNQVTFRQDWTRIKENDNGIDNQTGIRHYLGNFLEETQTPSGGAAVVTGESQGVMTLREPLVFSTGPLAGGVPTRVDVVQFIGPQASWLEPYQVSDERVCAFLHDGHVRPVDPQYTDNCIVNSGTTYTYNGVTFTGNIVNCSQTTWP